MSLVRCRHCGGLTAEGAFCEKCGKSLDLGPALEANTPNASKDSPATGARSRPGSGQTTPEEPAPARFAEEAPEPCDGAPTSTPLWETPGAEAGTPPSPTASNMPTQGSTGPWDQSDSPSPPAPAEGVQREAPGASGTDTPGRGEIRDDIPDEPAPLPDDGQDIELRYNLGQVFLEGLPQSFDFEVRALRDGVTNVQVYVCGQNQGRFWQIERPLRIISLKRGRKSRRALLQYEPIRPGHLPVNFYVKYNFDGETQ